MNNEAIGIKMHGWAQDLFPVCRSITGDGVRSTLAYIQALLPSLKVFSVPSGANAFDWVVPNEWVIRDAYVLNENGERIIDFRAHNLHVVGYSEPVDRWLDLKELNEHLYSLPEQPDAIPYITSYYSRQWGFCLTHKQRLGLRPGRYRAVIDSDLKPGVLNYGELILKGSVDEEVFLSTYICHPSMANNELSGPVVTMALAQWLSGLSNRRYTYRIIFIPETIGSIVYLSNNIDCLRKKVIAGFNVTCIGDDRCYSYLPSRAGDSLSDNVALHVLGHIDPEFKRYDWLARGSDERQYCAPGVDLPIASIMRSKYAEYPEYHTSLDDLNLISPGGLEGGLHALKQAINILEKDQRFITTTLGEPQLGRRGLYPNLSTKETNKQVEIMMNLISYCDGRASVLDIANLIKEPFWNLMPIVEKLVSHGLLIPALDSKNKNVVN